MSVQLKNVKRHIPAKVRRELRQEANFGCAVCGAPIIDYHHIIPWSKREHHDPDDMIALCPNHHRPSDDSVIPESELYEYKKKPHNSDEVNYLFHFDSNQPRFRMGALDIVLGEGPNYSVVKIGDSEIFSISFVEDTLTFSIKLHDRDGHTIAQISNNEWTAYTDQIWDLEYKSKNLSLWDPNQELRLRISYNVGSDRIKFEAKFYYGGVEFEILPSKIVTSEGATVDGDGEIIYSGRTGGPLFYTEKGMNAIALGVY